VIANLHDLLRAKRQELIDRWSQRIQSSLTAEPLARGELVDQMPFFIDDLIAALHPVAAPLPGASPSAEEHGGQRLRLGFDAGEVIREYGILQSCIYDMAKKEGLVLCNADCELLSTSVNAGTAAAISQFVHERDAELQRQSAEHMGFIAHELRNPLGSARMAFALLGEKGALQEERSAQVLDRSLRRVSELIDNALTHSWLESGAPPRLEAIGLSNLLTEVANEAALEARARGIEIVTAAEAVIFQADIRLLRSSVSNLLRNALKFSRANSTVVLRGRRHDGGVAIEVQDACGGLPPGKAEELFAPFAQQGADRSGFGLGLAIARQAVEAHHGTVRVQNRPSEGCTFIIELPG
jgi:signal transduction histidine kinase